METSLIIIGVILLIVGMAGCILPFLPGPPIGYAALIMLQLTDKKPFSTTFMVVMGVVVAVVTLLDYIIPIWGTKKFGGTKSGMWGATIGLVAGLFFNLPFGIITGPFVGAYLGELRAKRPHKEAIRAALGSFLGFVIGTILKIIVMIFITYYFIHAAF